MAKLHWYCQYNTHIVDKESGEDISNYALSFSDKTISNIFISNEYGTDLNDVELNIKSIEDAESQLNLYASGAYEFEEENIQFFPLMDDNDKEAVYNGEIYRGTKTIAIAVDVELDGYEKYSSQPDKRGDQQYMLFQWSYEDLNGGDGTFDDPPEIENDIQMSSNPPSPITWAWIIHTDINFYGKKQEQSNNSYQINHITGQPFSNRFIVFSGSNSAAMSGGLDQSNPSWANVEYSSQQSAFHFVSNVYTDSIVTSDPNHNYVPLDFYTLTNNGTYSAETTEDFFYSASSHGHQTAVFSGKYNVYGVCLTGTNGTQHYTINDVYNYPQSPTNNCTLLQNVFKVNIKSEHQGKAMSKVDVGLGYAGGGLTAGDGYVRLITSSTSYSDIYGMPCFISRIGSPGGFTTVSPNIEKNITLQTTGEVASRQRAISLWPLFDDNSELGNNNELGFTHNDIESTYSTKLYIKYDSGRTTQDGNSVLLTSELCSYYGVSNVSHYVDEANNTNWTYQSYTVNNTSLSLNGSEQQLGQIKLSASTKYIIGCPMFFMTSGCSFFGLGIRVGTPQFSFNLQYFYRNINNWSSGSSSYINPNLYNYKEFVAFSPGAILLTTPSTISPGFYNIYGRATCTTGGTAILKTFQHQMFYHPITMDNYLETDIPNIIPIDAHYI